MQSILLFLQAPDVDVLGITLVAGDQWIKEQTQRTLRAVEIAGRTDVPVVPGAVTPLINSKEESEIWEQQLGQLSFKGAWTPRTYHDPDVVPELKEGVPSIKPLDEHAANFIIRMVHKYPNEVTIWAGGPLTNIALALRLDPQVATLAKELVLMGAGFNVGQGGIHRINGRREFNWWFDPESVRIAMSAPWKKITITPVDISVKTRLGDEHQGGDREVEEPGGRVPHQVRRRQLHVGRDFGAGVDGSVDHHEAAGAVREHRHRPWRQLRADDLRREGAGDGAGTAAGPAEDGAVVEAVDRAVGPRHREVLQDVHRPDVAAAAAEGAADEACA